MHLSFSLKMCVTHLVFMLLYCHNCNTMLYQIPTVNNTLHFTLFSLYFKHHWIVYCMQITDRGKRLLHYWKNYWFHFRLLNLRNLESIWQLLELIPTMESKFLLEEGKLPSSWKLEKAFCRKYIPITHWVRFYE